MGMEIQLCPRVLQAILACAILFTPTFGVPVKQDERLDPMYGKYFEGDMRFAEGFDPKNGVIGERFRWPNHTVPYLVSEHFGPNETAIIAGALEEISNKTCIKFVERTTEFNHVYIERGLRDSGCWSFVGRIQTGRQILNLEAPPPEGGAHCIWHGTAAHEMIHAIGFHHEQSRTDRDDYVTIMWDNIGQLQKHNFVKLDSSQIDPQGVPYDYGSLMHYGAYAFAVDPSLPTIVPKEDVQIGQRNGLSEADALKIRTMYKCDDE